MQESQGDSSPNIQQIEKDVIIFQQVSQSEEGERAITDSDIFVPSRSVHNKQSKKKLKKRNNKDQKKNMIMAGLSVVFAIAILVLLTLLITGRAETPSADQNNVVPKNDKKVNTNEPAKSQNVDVEKPGPTPASVPKALPQPQSPVPVQEVQTPNIPPPFKQNPQPAKPQVAPPAPPQAKPSPPPPTPAPAPVPQTAYTKKVSIPIAVPQIKQGGHIPSYLHKHNGITFDYPTMGVPIPGQTYNSTPVQDKDLAQFDQVINELFKPYNVPITYIKDTDCDFVRYGQNGDGGYVMCKNFLSRSQGLINVGINGYDQFGCDITTAHPMGNYQYDCTNPTQPPCGTNHNNNLFTYACIGTHTQKSPSHTFHSFEDMLKSHNLTDKYFSLKIDCQGGQFPGFQYFPTKYLQKLQQIVIEIHFEPIYYQVWGILDILRTLDKYFVSVNYHFNNWSCFKGGEEQLRKLKGNALEVTLVNRKLITLKSESRSYKMHPLNIANNQWGYDCQCHD